VTSARVLALLLALSFAPAGTAPAAERPLEDRIVEAAERVKPLVVHIEAIVKIHDRRNQVTGSGVIASPDGRILTNEHVVEKAEKVTVSVPGRRKKYPARVVGTDKQTDIALLRIDPDGPLPAARFGSDEGVRVGQWVLAIGNPYGLDGTVSLGIVSAMGRNLEIPNLLNDFIQTDAMIDRGSSGGPLVDLEGRVVGINSRGQGRGIGFTIPIDTALEVVEQLERGGIARGYLGVTLQPLDRDLADYFGIPDVTGVVVNSVAEETPAARAKLRTGDIITAFDDVTIEAEKEEDIGNLQRLVASHVPGDEVRMRILRGGREKELKVVLAPQPTFDPAEEESDVGFHVREITPLLAREQRLSTESGAWVQFVVRGSPAGEAGVRIGDVIQRIEDRSVEDLDDFRRAMREVEERTRFLVVTRRGQETKYLLVNRRARPAEEADPEGDEEPASRSGD
jgi:S1-C subfamily serine protease